jgi:hypothetical protein
MNILKNLYKSLQFVLAAILLACSVGVQAEKLASQNWVVDLNGQTNEAYTANDSKSSFGVFCSGEKCLFYLHQSLKCDPGAKYSVLMNSLAISTALSMECTQIGGNLFQILDPFEAVLKAAQAGEMIGFAVALQSGAFAVNRFSLVGAKPAIERALLEAAKSKFRDQKPPPENIPKSTLKDIAI